MLDRYVDDANLAAEIQKSGTRYDVESGELKWSLEAKLEDNSIEDDQKTMVLVREIANSVHPMLQFEEDFPSRYVDCKLPILDLKCWLNDDTNTIWYEHYEKAVATKKSPTQ